MDSYDEIGTKLDNSIKESMTKYVNSLEETSKTEKELPLFIEEWLQNGLNASAAYKKLHPEVTEGSARTLGSRWLAKVNTSEILIGYNITLNDFFETLKAGLKAEKIDQFSGERLPDYKVRLECVKIVGKLYNLPI